MSFRILMRTSLTEEECRKIIDKQTKKDKEQADMLVKIMEGKSGELSYMRRKVGGAVLSQVLKVIPADKKDWMIMNLKDRAENGTERFISWDRGVIILEFSDFDMIGTEYLHRKKAAENNLMKRFKATDLVYLDEVGVKPLEELK